MIISLILSANLYNLMNIYQVLDEHSIPYKRFDHKAVFDCEAADALGLDTQGIATKNLFLKDRKGRRHFLVVVRSDKALDLKSLGQTLEVKGLSFASAERLDKHLSSTAGSVSILDILRDAESAVELIIDQSVLDSPMLQCHPFTNTATLDIAVADMKRLLEAHQCDFKAIQL